MAGQTALLETLGGEAGCRRLSVRFYARVGADPELHPLFPGKSLRCAIEEFAAFLIQFLGGDEEQTQSRWWLSLRESHDRFRIASAQRGAWLKHMAAALEEAGLDQATRTALHQFFRHGSSYVMGREDGAFPQDGELAARWREQRMLDDAIDAIAAGRDEQALALAAPFASRPSVFVGLLARMAQSRRAACVSFAIGAVRGDPSLAVKRFAGGTLLHFAAGAGCVELVASLLRIVPGPDVRDRGGHTPLYRVANECGSDSGPRVVRLLVEAGADVNARGGVTRATPLHMAARRGHLAIASVLLECGAAIDAIDRKGDTPLKRAIHCRREAVARLLLDHGALSA